MDNAVILDEAKLSNIKIYEVDGEGSPGHKWRPGARYSAPYLSFAALFLVLGICAGIIAVIVTSNGQDVQQWNSHAANVFGHDVSWSIAVNVWLSGFVFFSGKLVALIFAEAVTIAWWVRAMRGRTLKQLTHDFDAGRSITAIVKRPMLFSWICLGSIAFTGFSGFGTILQKSTSVIAVPQHLEPVQLTTKHATRLPYGWSGASSMRDPIGPWTPPLIRVMDEYGRRQPVQLSVSGCSQSPDTYCAAQVRGIGFQVNCSVSRGALKPFKSQDKVSFFYRLWQVSFGWSYSGLDPNSMPAEAEPWTEMINPGIINLRALFKNETGTTGKPMVVQSCRLIPAIVDYPVTVKAGEATLLPASSAINWDTPHEGMLDTPMDPVVQVLKHPYESWEVGNRYMASWYAPSTFGGLFSAFNSIYTSEITYDDTMATAGLAKSNNSFALKYMSKSYPPHLFKGVESPESAPMGANTDKFASPMDDVLAGVREIMFRTSIDVIRHPVKDMVSTSDTQFSRGNSEPAVVSHQDPYGSIDSIHTVYKSNYYYLFTAIGLMLLALGVILPLFWGYWRLGRKVSLSPLELAAALYANAGSMEAAEASVFESRAGGGISNANTDELLKTMGDIKVRYGQVAPEALGLAVENTVTPPISGSFYR